MHLFSSHFVKKKTTYCDTSLISILCNCVAMFLPHLNSNTMGFVHRVCKYLLCFPFQPSPSKAHTPHLFDQMALQNGWEQDQSGAESLCWCQSQRKTLMRKRMPVRFSREMGWGITRFTSQVSLWNIVEVNRNQS